MLPDPEILWANMIPKSGKFHTIHRIMKHYIKSPTGREYGAYKANAGSVQTWMLTPKCPIIAFQNLKKKN